MLLTCVCPASVVVVRSLNALVSMNFMVILGHLMISLNDHFSTVERLYSNFHELKKKNNN